MKYPITQYRIIAIDGTNTNVINSVITALGDRLQNGHESIRRQINSLIGQGPFGLSVQHSQHKQTPMQFSLGLATAILETYGLEVAPYLSPDRIQLMNRWIGSYYAYRCQAGSDPLPHSVYYQGLVKTLKAPMAYIWLDTPASRAMPMPLYSLYREHEQHFEPYMNTIWKGYAEYYDYLKRSGTCPYMVHITDPLDSVKAIEQHVSTWLEDPAFIALFGA